VCYFLFNDVNSSENEGKETHSYGWLIATSKYEFTVYHIVGSETIMEG